MTNEKIQMTNEIQNSNIKTQNISFVVCALSFVIQLSFVLCYLSFREVL